MVSEYLNEGLKSVCAFVYTYHLSIAIYYEIKVLNDD